MSETIFALSTPSGRSGIAVVRASGIDAFAGLRALSGKDFSVRTAHLTDLRYPSSGILIDRAVVLYFSGPASFTGEDVVEYFIHGGPAVIESLLAALAACPGHRMAEPGEFTRRAFENGKLDLAQAEAVADLIHAETEAQKIQALSQMEGALSRLYGGWTERLKNHLAHIEADIEFPDEDLPGGILPSLLPALAAIESEIAAHLDDNRRGERLRGGLHVAVVGAPNAGKSSLVNALVQRDIAIVSSMPGTTRDVIEAHLDIAGYPVILADTAGLRPEQLKGALNDGGHEAIESEGIRRAIARAGDADIKILLFDGGAGKMDQATLRLKDGNSIIAVNKSDIHDKIYDGAISISAVSGAGLDQLLKALEEKIKEILKPSETPSLTRMRHRKALEEARDALRRAQNVALPELSAEDIRLAVRALGRITGRVDVEDVLDAIFRDFCIGK